MSSTVSDADSRAADYETVERRYTIAVNLESWELLAMHSIASDESIPRVRLRMLKSLAGLHGIETPPPPPQPQPQPASSASSASSSSPASRRALAQ